MQGISRRTIIYKCVMLGLSFLGNNRNWGRAMELGRKLVILHTNDTHSGLSVADSTRNLSRVDELLVARHEMIQKIREEGFPVLLLDSGDFTGIFPNILTKEMPPVWKALQIMGYDAVAFGDGEMAAGKEMFDFHWGKVGIPLLACNYTPQGTAWEKWVSPYCILNKGNIRIGIIGVGILLSNCLSETISMGIVCDDPIKRVNACVTQLRNQGCELIICLSHLGDQGTTEKFHDFQLAQENVGIDIIFGAHSHRLYEQPRRFINKIGGITLVNQMGRGGGYLGRMDCFFPKKGTTKTLKANRLFLEKKIAK
ncbi:MAG: metallophosphoesterase [Chitinophagia bacterium]